VLKKDEFYEYRNIVISGGGSAEKIDDVRFIGNFSSGKMSAALALAFYVRGAYVTLVTSTPNDFLPLQIAQVMTSSGEEFKMELQSELEKARKPKMTKPSLMHSAQIQSVSKKPILIMAAAIADYKPKEKHGGKLKKEKLGSRFALELTQTEDILMTLDRDGIVSIGFKAEFDEKNAKKSGKKMLNDKNLDAVCLNILGAEVGFGSDENEIIFITQESEKMISKADKLSVSFEIAKQIKQL
jgi:phosphopantothenoylcysteine decarboxylase/phosphopantothenate--cysteine ligase